MKKYISIFAIAISAIVWGCNSKPEKTAEQIAAAETAKEDSLKNAAATELANRKAMLKKARETKELERRTAMEEQVKASLTFKDASGKLVYRKSEVAPSYAGGDDAMAKYLSDNLKYPESAQRKGIEGTVFVDFIVDKKGKVREVVATETTLLEVDSTLVNEAIRVVSEMPAWVAGSQHGKPVDVAYSIPISFETGSF